MTAPKRIQLRRTKGWRKPEGAVVVARPTKWGNPFRLADCIEAGFADTVEQARAVCVEAFQSCMKHGPQSSWWPEARRLEFEWMADHVAELSGRDLACWCPLEDAHGTRVPCHADVLLQLANPEVDFSWT